MVPEYTEKVYASGPPKEILECADVFFEQLPPYYRKTLTVDGITINSAGTISLDWAQMHGGAHTFVSVEVGLGRLGFFCEMPDGLNSEGVYLIGNECPKPILKALQKMHGRSSD